MDVLFQINITRNILQLKIINLPRALAILKSVEDLRTNGFVRCLLKAKYLAEDLEVEGNSKQPGLELRRSSLMAKLVMMKHRLTLKNVLELTFFNQSRRDLEA